MKRKKLLYQSSTPLASTKVGSVELFFFRNEFALVFRNGSALKGHSHFVCRDADVGFGVFKISLHSPISQRGVAESDSATPPFFIYVKNRMKRKKTSKQVYFPDRFLHDIFLSLFTAAGQLCGNSFSAPICRAPEEILIEL